MTKIIEQSGQPYRPQFIPLPRAVRPAPPPDMQDIQDQGDEVVETSPEEAKQATRDAIRAEVEQERTQEDIRAEVEHNMDEEAEWDDMFNVSDDDVTGGDIDEVTDANDDDEEEDDFSDITDMSPEDDLDLFGVDSSDVMGDAPKPKRKKKLMPLRRLPTPPTGLGGVGQ